MKFGYIALGVLAAASLLAQYGGPGPRGPHAGMKNPQRQAAALESLKTFLNLSDAQVQQLSDMTAQHRASVEPLSAKIRANQTTVNQLMNSGAEPDAAKVGQLVVESRTLRMQMQASQQELVQKTTAVLTPAQQEKLATLPATALAQRQASPGSMPEAWPMLRAAAQLGLIAPPAHGEGGPAAMHFRGGPGTPPPPAAQN